MDARLMLVALVLSTLSSTVSAATYRTRNFVVTAQSAEFAKQVGDSAEFYRDRLAVMWLGKKMPRWYKPCTISVKTGQIGAGGATTFSFDRGEVFGWRMNIQGSEERILDSVLPHEVSHTVFACHFRRPLPRWADEGAATLVEHESERHRQFLLLKQVWNSNRRIPLKKLLAMKEYPRDMKDVMTLYAEGYSLADYLVQLGGRSRYLQFLEDAHQQSWDSAIEQHYELQGVSELESEWNGWIMAGSPRLNLPEGQQLADNGAEKTAENTRPAVTIRSQSPDEAPTTNPRTATRTRGDGLQAPDPRRSRLPRPLGFVRRSEATSATVHPARPASDAIPFPADSQPRTQPRRPSGFPAGSRRALNDGWEPQSQADQRPPQRRVLDDGFSPFRQASPEAASINFQQ